MSGCSAAPDQLPVYPAEGRVVFNGEPLDGAKIFFVPEYPFPVDGKKQVPTPSAQTDEDGNFVVSTYKQGDGLPEGTYKVRLSCANKDKPVLDRYGKPVRGEFGELLPDRYLNEDQSGIQVSVEPQKNQFDEFVLQK